MLAAWGVRGGALRKVEKVRPSDPRTERRAPGFPRVLPTFKHLDKSSATIAVFY